MTQRTRAKKEPISYLAKVHSRLLRKRRAISAEINERMEIVKKLQAQLAVIDQDICAIEKAVL